LATGLRSVGLVVALALTAAVVAHGLLNLAISSGAFIPQDDLTTDYAIGVVWAAALGVVLWVSPVRQSDRMVLAVAWLGKGAVTLVFMLLYEASYDLDAYEYFAGPHRAWYTSGFSFGLGTDNVMALSWLQQEVLPGSYHALKVSCSFIGLIGVYLFYRAAEIHTGRTNRKLFLALLFFPSILFWSSILGKDPLILFAIAVHTLGLVMWHRSRSAWSVTIALLGLVLAAAIRPWLAPILLAPLAVVAFRLAGNWRRRAAIVGGSLGSLVLLVIVVSRLFNASSLQGAIQAINLLSRAWATGGSGQEGIQTFSGIGSMVAFLPLGAFTALFRPLPGEIANVFGMLAGLENLALLVLAFCAVRRTRRHAFANPMVLWATALVVSWTFVYAFISYQNLGTAIRFKVQILPVLLLLLLHLATSRTSSARTD
jgi:hypothetical protein